MADFFDFAARHRAPRRRRRLPGPRARVQRARATSGSAPLPGLRRRDRLPRGLRPLPGRRRRGRRLLLAALRLRRHRQADGLPRPRPRSATRTPAAGSSTSSRPRPGPLVATTDEVVEHLADLDGVRRDVRRRRTPRFRADYLDLEDGHAGRASSMPCSSPAATPERTSRRRASHRDLRQTRPRRGRTVRRRGRRAGQNPSGLEVGRSDRRPVSDDPARTQRNSVKARLSSMLQAATSRVRRTSPGPSASGNQAAGTSVNGMVEEFSKRLVTGWISLPADAPPTKVDLYLGRLKVASTYATEDGAMSGSGSALRGGRSARRPPRGAGPQVAGPDDQGPGRRPAQLAAAGAHLRVPRARDLALRQQEHQDLRSRRRATAADLQARHVPVPATQRAPSRWTILRERAATQGYLLTQWGTSPCRRSWTPNGRTTVMNLYQRTRKILARRVRVRRVLHLRNPPRRGPRGRLHRPRRRLRRGATSPRRPTGPEAAARACRAIALALIEHGLDVDAHATALHITDPEDPGHRIDLFHTYFDDAGVMRFPFGVAGLRRRSPVTTGAGTKRWTSPAAPAWSRSTTSRWSRTSTARTGATRSPGSTGTSTGPTQRPRATSSTEQRTKVYWANFYSRNRLHQRARRSSSSSTRCPTLPQNVLDIGCGDGRDSCAFGAAGRTVLGRGPVAGRHRARQRRTRPRSASRTRCVFRTCDVADTDDVGAALDGAVRGAVGGAGGVLHALLPARDPRAGPGRPDEGDRDPRPARATGSSPSSAPTRTRRTAKVHTKHYRRFQNAEAFRDSPARPTASRSSHFEEGTGLLAVQGRGPGPVPRGGPSLTPAVLA